MSAYPKPSARVFDEMSRNNPELLDAWICSGELVPTELTFAAEALGGASDGVPFVDTLIMLLLHESPLVREGAVYGLARQCSALPFVRSWLEILSMVDPSPGVRLAICDMLATGHA